MNQFIDVRVETRAQDCSALVMYVLCVPWTCSSFRQHGKHFQCLRVCEHLVPFVLTDSNTENCTAMVSSSDRTQILCNALVSVPQLSGVMLILGD